MRVEATTLHLDVGELADEMKRGVENWISQLEATPTTSKAVNVERNLSSLVRVTQSAVPTTGTAPGGPTISIFSKTN
jgi:hypothetical protein